MSLQTINVPLDNNSILSALILSLLLPIINDEEKFDQTFNRLFSGASHRIAGRLILELESYTPEQLPASLTQLINTRLRPQITQHMMENKEEYIPLFKASETQFIEAIENFRHGNKACQRQEIMAVTHLLNINLFAYKNSKDKDPTVSYLSKIPSETSVHIVITDNVCQYMIDPMTLSETLRKNLRLVVNTPAEPISVAIDPQLFKHAKLQQILAKTLSIFPQQLSTISAKIPRINTTPDPFSAPTPTNMQLFMRFDAQREIQSITREMTKVNLTDPKKINGTEAWVRSMTKSSAVGSLSSLSTIGLVTLIGELGIGAGIGIGAIPVVGLPIAAVMLVSVLGAAVFGKHFAIRFEKMLAEVHALLNDPMNENRYAQAADLLDEEFKRFLLTRALRDLFLTHQHHAIGHFFRALCAEKRNDEMTAYLEYKKAFVAASRAGSSLTVFVSQLQLLKLLKNSTNAELSSSINRNIEIDRIIIELTAHFQDGISDLYWKIHTKMTGMAFAFASGTQLSDDQIESANTFLITDGLFMLKHFSGGLGQFMELFGTFFQGATLVYFNQTNQSYLKENTKLKLHAELGTGIAIHDDLIIIKLAHKKLSKAAAMLKIFKNEHGYLSQHHAGISTSIKLMETFMLTLFTLWINEENISSAQFQNIADSLFIDRSQVILHANDIQSSIGFLTRIHRDFGLVFNTIDDWLDALLTNPSAIADKISDRTGDTMLHLLVELPNKDGQQTKHIQDAALILKELRYKRNHQNNSPLVTLEIADPLQLKKIIYTELFVKTGSELDQVENIVGKIKATPSVESHFILLDGPPGTGKTTTVLSHLKALGYPIIEWERGNKGDKYVGALVTRIEDFFKDAKKKAATNGFQILFIDEIDAIVPIVEGVASNGSHNQNAEITAFQIEISKLKNHPIVLIGATNFPERLAKPIMDRAGTNRIYFPLPDVAKRRQLLHYFFRQKIIDTSSIELLADTAVGYSQRQLQSFVDTIKETTITLETMTEYFNTYARTLSKDFNNEFNCATLFMPSFEKEGELGNLFSSNLELEEQLIRLQRDATTDPQKHTLLYGPPGGGKTTAVRVFSQTAGRVLISIQADQTTSKKVLGDIFTRAKQLGRAIIFFDEIDRVAQKGTLHTAFLQTEMDGIIANDITIIGATNHPERIEPAIMSRFSSKILLPKLDEIALNKPIKKILLESVAKYNAVVYFDTPLAEAIKDGATELGLGAAGLDLRSVSGAIGYLMGDLSREKKGAIGITYLKLQDVIFALYIKKIQENIIERPHAETATCTRYIRDNKSTFFPNEIPPNSTPAPRLSMKMI